MDSKTAITLTRAQLQAILDDEGMDKLIERLVAATYEAIGGQLTADTLAMLNADQATLLAYDILRSEVMDGGFVQLIHNGYGAFFFRNPFAKMMRIWGIADLARLMNKAHKCYTRHGAAIEQECTDDEFMALFEQYPDFDDLDDDFVAHEEEYTTLACQYIMSHLEVFTHE